MYPENRWFKSPEIWNHGYPITGYGTVCMPDDSNKAWGGWPDDSNKAVSSYHIGVDGGDLLESGTGPVGVKFTMWSSEDTKCHLPMLHVLIFAP